MTDARTPLEAIDSIEAWLGDPLDPGNPFAADAILAADERAELLAPGEQSLDEYGLGAEFVPHALGGRLRQVDTLAQILRAVFRRDPTLALGYGVTSYIAGAPVWACGDSVQRKWMADVLLRHGKAAAAYNELAHGNDFTRTELRASPRGGDLVLNGRKELVNNVARAGAIVLFARTDDRPGNRAHSHLLLDPAAIPGDRWSQLPRFLTTGMRGCLLGGMEFRDCPLPADCVIGEPGAGMETVLRAFQTTRGLIPAMAIGGLDTQLRLAMGFARERRMYGRALAEIPHARSVLVNAFLDLLISDCLATVTARALHVLPGQTSVYTAAAKYLVPKTLHAAAYDLSVLLGARSYLREGPHALFQKTMRDVAVATFGHANATVCQATMIPQLPRLAQRSWRSAGEPPSALFRFGDSLPDLDYGSLELTSRGEDSVTAVLPGSLAQTAGEPALRALCEEFVAELMRLKDHCLALLGRDRTVVAGPWSFDLADRYTTALAAAACLGVFRTGGGGDPFLADPAWVTAALWRLAGRLGREQRPLPAGLDQKIYAELQARHDTGHAFDLANRSLARAPELRGTG